MVESYEMPFIYVLQDQKILNNHLYVSSSSNVGNTNIYVIDLTTKTISTIISDFRSAIKDHELEGIDFIPYETRYNLILHVQNGSFYTMWFER